MTDMPKCKDGGICGIGGFCKDCPLQHPEKILDELEFQQLKTGEEFTWCGQNLHIITRGYIQQDAEITRLKEELAGYKEKRLAECPMCKEKFFVGEDGSIDAFIGA